MFLDLHDYETPRQPRPEPPRRRLSKRGERLVIWLLVGNAILLFAAPVGGATLFQALF